MTPIEAACLWTAIAALTLLGALIMATVQSILSRQNDLSAKLDLAIANKAAVQPTVATQADLDAIAGNVEAANGQADLLIAAPAPAPPAP